MPTNTKFTKMITTIVLPITVAVVVAVATNACKPEPDDTPPPICKCEAGTEHLPGDNSCESMTNGCDNCITIPGTTVQGIPVTNRNNAVETTTFNTILTNGIEAALEDLELEEIAILKDKVKEIRIITGLGPVSHSSGVITIKETGWGKIDIQNALYDNIYVVQSNRCEMVAATKNHSVPLHLTTPYRAVLTTDHAEMYAPHLRA